MEELILSSRPKLEHQLHWMNSSNVLCNYMKEQAFLDKILTNRAIIPRYVMEPLEYLDIKELSKICFPMTCFCDIPFSKVSTHMSRYGEYGIGLDKEAVLKKYGIQPIHYMNDKSPLTNDFREAFQTFYKADIKLQGAPQMLLNYLSGTLLYMKPIWGSELKENGDVKNYVYQDECEWRYIPNNFPKELHLILPQNETTEIAKQKYSEVLVNHPECWLRFEWRDVRYIMVPDEASVKNTIGTLLALDLEDSEKYMLISKIEVSKRFSDNM